MDAETSVNNVSAEEPN